MKPLTEYRGNTDAPPQTIRSLLNQHVVVKTEDGEVAEGFLADFERTRLNGLGNLLLLNSKCGWILVKGWQMVAVKDGDVHKNQ